MMKGRGMVRSFVYVAAAVLAVMFCLRAARADDEPSLIGQIESVLGEIKNKLDGASSSSSTSDIDRVVDYARQVEDLAEKLRSANPQSDKGKTMGSYYRDYARKFGESVKYLRQLKEKQLQQGNERLAEKCHDAQDRLRGEIKGFVEKNDPAGISKIPELAEAAARDLQEPVRRDAETHRQMEQWKGNAKNFSETDGAWSDVKSKLHSETDKIWETWRQRFENTNKSENCGDLVRTKENPIVVAALTQLSSNNEVRKGVIKELDVQIKNAYDAVKEIDRRSDDGASQIQDATRAVDETLKLLDKLRYAQGDDDNAKRITDSWPDKVKALQEALSALGKLKAGQHLVDRGVEVCTQAETELRDLIKQEIDARDERTDGWKRIDEKARELGATFSEKLQKAVDYGREMESWKNEATRWTAPDGHGWPDVKSGLNAAAEGTNNYYKSTLEKVDVACKQLSWGTGHPEVKKAAGVLKEHASARDSDYVKLRDQAKKFREEVRKYRALVKEDEDKIHELVCVKGSERDDDDMEEAIGEIADRWASQLESDWHIIEPAADQIRRDADVLIERKVPNASKIKRSIDDLMKSITKSRDGLNKGANDPIIQKAIQCGIAMHKEMGKSCTIREKTVSSRYCENPHPKRKRADCRIDCIDGCTLVEFKPDNKAAKDQGEAQSKAYTEGLRKWYRIEGDKLFEDDFQKLQACVKGDSDRKWLALVDGGVKPYEFCKCFPNLREGVDPEEPPSLEIPETER